MAGSVNKVILIGRLGKDPETVSFSNGNKAVKFPFATSETWKDKNSGERKERTDWHNVVIYAPGLANIAEQYLRKGTLCYLEGQLQTRNYEKDGQKHYMTEVVLQPYNSTLTMLGGRGDSGGGAGGGGGGGGGDSPPAASGGGSGGGGGSTPPPMAGGGDDDIPF